MPQYKLSLIVFYYVKYWAYEIKMAAQASLPMGEMILLA